jgi:hypothetical protein
MTRGPLQRQLQWTWSETIEFPLGYHANDVKYEVLCILINLLEMQGHLELMRARSGKADRNVGSASIYPRE